MSYKQIDEQFDKEFDDFFLPCPDEVRNELKSFLHQIYDQAKAEQIEECKLKMAKSNEWWNNKLKEVKAEQREVDALIAENYVKQWKFPKDSDAKIHYTTVGNEIATAIRQEGK